MYRASVLLAFTATKKLFFIEIADTSISCATLFGFVMGLIYKPLKNVLGALQVKLMANALLRNINRLSPFFFATGVGN